MTALHAPAFTSKPTPGFDPGSWAVCWVVWLAMSTGLWVAGQEAPAGEGAQTRFRFGFSSQMFSEVNENDVKAAVKVWAQALVNERKMAVDMQPSVFNGAEKLIFFRQVDVYLVNRRGFETMKELNPQLGQQLKVLAASPELVPSVFCFRTDFSSSMKEQLLAEIAKVHQSPSGQQVLTMFQSERLEERPVVCLDSALELLVRHRRLSAATTAVEPAVHLSPNLAKEGAR